MIITDITVVREPGSSQWVATARLYDERDRCYVANSPAGTGRADGPVAAAKAARYDLLHRLDNAAAADQALAARGL